MIFFNRYCLAATILLLILTPHLIVAQSANPFIKGKKKMMLASTSFKHNQEIPKRHTCDGENISPPLTWQNLPKDAKSLALIVYDPDAPDPKAPKMTWVHWVLYNLPAKIDSIGEGCLPQALPSGTLMGQNDWKQTGYGGPCPPVGRHRYFHKLFALDIVLPDLNSPTKAALIEAMQGHILAETELIGTYQRSR